MTVEEDRAIRYLQDQGALLRNRRAMAMRLIAPPYPRARVVAAWAPVLPDPGNPTASARESTPPPAPLPTGGATFTGHGPPPSVIVGALPGATYLDLDSGDLYRLS